jgi:tetratricopeptide (TPR) repeat protein
MQPQAMHQQIHKLFHEEKYGLAAGLLKSMMQTNGNDPFVWTAQARLQCVKKKFLQAKQSVARALQINNSYAWAHSSFGVIEAKMKNHKEAAEAFEVAIKLEPDNVEVLYDYVIYLEETKIDLSKAHRLVTRRMILLPDDAENYELMGRVLLADNEIAEAEQSFRTAIRLDPALEKGYIGLAKIELFHKKNAFAASEWIRAALLIHPDSLQLRQYFNQAQKDKNEVFGLLWSSGVFYGASVKWSLFLAISLFAIIPFIIFIRDTAPQVAPFLTVLFSFFIAYCLYCWSSRIVMRILLEKRWLN